MKKRRVVTILTAMIAVNYLSCMEQNNQIKCGQKDDVEKLEITLKDHLITTNGIEHTRFQPDTQYEMLKTCIQNNDSKCLKLCLKYKFSPNSQRKKQSLLHYAIRKHNHIAVLKLSKYNADLTPRNRKDQTPLDYAISSKCVDCINLMADVIVTKINELLEYQKQRATTQHALDPNLVIKYIDLIWQLRCHQLKENDPAQYLAIFLKNSLTTTNNIEYSSVSPDLQYAMLRLYIRTHDMLFLKLCLEYKFNPNRYRKQLSLLHYAIQYNRPEAINILSQYNPDLLPLNEDGQTPLDYGISLERKNCIDEMAHAMASKSNELLILQKHCGLTKHMLKPGPCKACVELLRWQLRYHSLHQSLLITENAATSSNSDSD